MDEKNNLMNFTGAANLPGGFLNPAIPLPIRMRAAELFNMPFQVMEAQAEKRKAQFRLERIKEAADLAEQNGYGSLPDGRANVGVAQFITQKVPVDLVGDEHDTHIMFYREWLAQDDGLRASPVVQMCVRLKILEHNDAKASLAAYYSALEKQAMIPDMLANLVANSMTGVQDAAMQDASADKQMQRGMVQDEHKAAVSKEQQAGQQPQPGQQPGQPPAAGGGKGQQQPAMRM
jgi:hypothetical protein